MIYRIASLIVFYVLFGQQATAQVIHIYGRVTDSLAGNPVANAMVYITSDSLVDYLSYSTTDEQGSFSLHVEQAESDRELLLHVRSLGYAFKTIAIEGETEGPIEVSLAPSDYFLPDVVVSENAPAIIQKSDTVIYDLDQFRDSTEYNVEDLLEKLPGVEVLPDGSIRVNGKAVEKVLIEGSDLFGRQYTMGTKNIRADFIDGVEIIDHYQENPVLKDVNPSESIVLNLLLEEDSKDVLASSFDIGAGSTVTKEIAVKSNVNLFWISKKRKYLMLADNGNTLSNYTVNSLDYIYDGAFDSKSVTHERFIARDFQTFSDTRNPGLAPEFVDNSIRNFATIRSETDLSETWKIQANAVYSRKSELQHSSSTQTYLFDPSVYDLSTSTEMQLKRNLYEGNVLLKYLSAEQDGSFEAYFKWNKDKEFNLENLTEIRKDKSIDYLSEAESKQTNWFLSGLFTRKLSSSSAAQLLVTHFNFVRPQALSSQNADLPLLFELSENFSFLNQSLDYWHNGLSFSSRYLYSKKAVLLEAEAVYSIDNSGFNNAVYLSDSLDAQIALFGDKPMLDSLRRNSAELNLSMIVNLGHKTSLRLNNGVQRFDYHFLNASSGPVDKKFAFASGVKLSHKFSRKSTLDLSYRYGNYNPTLEDFFVTPYFRNGYELVQQGIRDANERQQQIRLSYRWLDAFKLRSLFVAARYHFAGTKWTETSTFSQSILLSDPFFSEMPNGLYLATGYNQFIAPLRSEVEIKPSWSFVRSNYFVDGELIDVAVENYRLRTAIRAQLFGSLTVALRSTFSQSINDDGRVAAKSGMIRNSFAVVLRKHKWIVYVDVNDVFWKTPSGKTHLTGVKSGVSKDFIVAEKEMRLSLLFVNLLNTKSYDLTRNGDLYALTSSIESVPLYFLLTFDYSF